MRPLEIPDRAPLRSHAVSEGERPGERYRRTPLVLTLALAVPACHDLEGDYFSPSLLTAAALPLPHPPAFDVECRLAATRRLPPTWLEELARAWRRSPPHRRGT